MTLPVNILYYNVHPNNSTFYVWVNCVVDNVVGTAILEEMQEGPKLIFKESSNNKYKLS